MQDEEGSLSGIREILSRLEGIVAQSSSPAHHSVPWYQIPVPVDTTKESSEFVQAARDLERAFRKGDESVRLQVSRTFGGPLTNRRQISFEEDLLSFVSTGELASSSSGPVPIQGSSSDTSVPANSSLTAEEIAALTEGIDFDEW